MREVDVMDDRSRLTVYFDQYRSLVCQEGVRGQIIKLKEFLQVARARGKKGIIAGNGGSAAIASHCAVDFTKTAGIRCINFNEADLITCLANDFGYEHWLEKALEMYADDGDVVILISSSGKSANMVRAGEYARSKGLTLVTFTGFREDNPLRQLGNLNFWVASRFYNIVEMTHHVWLLAACDLMIGSAEFASQPEITDAVNR